MLSTERTAADEDGSHSLVTVETTAKQQIRVGLEVVRATRSAQWAHTVAAGNAANASRAVVNFWILDGGHEI